MFIPEPGEEFHMYTEAGGLFQNTIFRCVDVNDKAVQGEYVAGNKPTFNGYAWFYRNKVSFWPVQPGYREHLKGEKFAFARALDRDLVKADSDFQKLFAKYKDSKYREKT